MYLAPQQSVFTSLVVKHGSKVVIGDIAGE